MTRKEPKISVVMPNFNCGKYIGETIKSILNQTFSDFEFIIIDDGSTDNSLEIIRNYSKKDKRIIVIENDKNLKICKTLNKGIKIARGEYIARMDSDDIALPNWLKTVLTYMELHKDIGVCGTNFSIINGNGEIIGEKKFPENDEECKNSIWYRNPFANNTVLIRSECFEEFGNYNPGIKYAEDLDLWVRFGTKYKFHNIQEKYVLYRIHGKNSILEKQKSMIKNTLLVRKKAVSLGYKIPMKGKFFFIGTWLMQFFPPKFVLWLFNKLL